MEPHTRTPALRSRFRVGIAAVMVSFLTAILLIASTTQAATVDRAGDIARGINGLVVGGVTYDVVFTYIQAQRVYGQAGMYLDFNTAAEAQAAVEAAAAVLTAEGGIIGVGGRATPIFRVGYELEGDGLAAVVKVWEGVRGDGGELDAWARVPDPDVFPYLDDGTFANFTVTSEPPPEPPTEPPPEPPAPPPEESDGWGFVRKQFSCPQSNITLRPAGSRFDIHDIEISTNKNQTVTLKLNPPNRVLLKLLMNAREHFQTNLSGQVESENQQALLLTCSGSANTTLTVTITGNGNL